MTLRLSPGLSEGDRGVRAAALPCSWVLVRVLRGYFLICADETPDFEDKTPDFGDKTPDFARCAEACVLSDFRLGRPRGSGFAESGVLSDSVIPLPRGRPSRK